MFKVSRVLAAVAIFIVAVIAFSMLMTGCQIATEENTSVITLEVVNKEPMAVRYEPPHYNAITEYEYQWDWWNGDYKLLPVIKNEYVEEKFFVQYAITYTDGSTEYVWNDVPQAIYYEIMRELSPSNVTEPTT